MSIPFTADYAGYLQLKKTGGAASSWADLTIPFVAAQPFNGQGNAYPDAVTTSGYPSLGFLGKKSAGFSIVTVLKPTWCTADFLNEMMFLLDSDLQTSKFACRLSNGVSTRVYDWSRCSMISIQGSAVAPTIVTMQFLSRWGETEAPYGTTLADGEVIGSAPSFSSASTDYGQVMGAADFDWGSSPGATHIRSYTLTLVRGVSYIAYTDGTRYPKDIATGRFSGALTLVGSPSGTMPTGTSALSLRMNTNKTSGTGRWAASMVISQDDYNYPQDSGLGNRSITYTLANLTSGGNPCTIAAY